jgi:hypothetical protein
MDGALINLVRTSLASASTEHDYTTGELFTRHDEIQLVDPTGDPCAVPLESGEDNIDYEYSYATGDRGRALRGTLIQPSLSIDYIENEVARRLEQWKRERAGVLVSPNMGRNTLMSWRAVDMKGAYFSGGPAAKDLTGNFSLTATFGAYLRYWDTQRRMFLPKTNSNRTQLVATPGGAGLVAYPPSLNRMKPTYPKSATLGSGATESGWIKGGADAADVTAALVTNGFGMTDCPHSLQITVAADTSIDRYLAISDQFNPAAGNYAGYTFVNTASATVVVWFRGQLPDGAYLSFGTTVGGDSNQRSLAGMRFDGWTPVSVSHSPTAWATNNPFVGLGLNSSTGIACSFEIGPVMVMQAASGYSGLQAAPVWTPEVTGGTSSGAPKITTGTLTLPGQGTLVTSFWVPEDMGGTWRASTNLELAGNTNLRLRLSIGVTTETVTVNSVSPATTLSTGSQTRGTLLLAGRINTIAVTWDGSSQKIYCNGTLMVTAVTAATTVPLGGSSSAWNIGTSPNGYTCAPLAMLTQRIDEGAMTADEVRHVHYALTDPIALGLAIECRGRTFRIVKTPRSMRSGSDGSQILGQLALEQTAYDQFLADPFAKEASVG